MKNQSLNLVKSINSAGTATFIKYFHEFAILSKKNLVILFERNNEPWNENSKGLKASFGKQIFEKNLELEALEHIILKKNENRIPNGIWVKSRAKDLYNEFSVTIDGQ